jgi:hypothetical protein
MAPVGHTPIQGASPHCWHIIGTDIPSRSQVKTWMRVAAGRNSFSWTNEHASTQFLHPVHLSEWIINNSVISILLLIEKSPVSHQSS